MPRFAAFICAVLALFALSACGAPRQIYTETPAHDPSDKVMSDSINAWLKLSGNPVSSRYEFVRTDLNGDTRRDALVMLQNPYGHWCDMYGCTMLVLRANDDSFSFVSAIRPVRGPVYISDRRSKGWNDIVIRVDGRWTRTKDVAMKFDGVKYPEDPAAEPPAYEYGVGKTGQRIFP